MAKDSRRLHRVPLAAAVTVAVTFGLAACGGGSGVKPTQSSSPPPSSSSSSPPPPSSSSVAQPPLDAQLSLTDTYAAHAAGYTGKGVTIGIVDSGIMSTNPTVAGRVLKELIYVDPTQNDTSVQDVVGHGTWVSEIAAGTSFDQFPGGIAPGADLVSARIISDKAPSDNGSTPPTTVSSSDALPFGQINDDLINAGVKVMNNSWGGISWSAGDTSTTQAFDQAYGKFVNDWGGLVVFAAGNDSNANPSTIAALPSLAPDLEKGWLVAVAVNSNDPTQLESYSNKCGKAMDYCLAAPGDAIVLGKDTTRSTTKPTYYIVEGTSFAAPQVSGAAALVWQAFPYFSNDLVRQTLLGTAKDLGAPGPDPTFGYGELDVGKAVQGPGKFDWGDVSVSFDSITSTWSNDITGAGGLSKNGTGTLVLAGNDSYQGDTNVLGGTLQSANALPGNVNVSAGATLSGVYASGALPVGVPGVKGNLDNAGTVTVAGVTTTVSGNYIQQTSGTLSLSLGSLLKVRGTATIKGGTLYIAGADQGYVTTAHQNVVTAQGGVSGTFDQLTTASNVFLSTTIQYDANDVWLDTTSLNITQTSAASVTAASAQSAQRVQLSFDSLNRQIASGSPKASGTFVAAAGAIQHAPTETAAEQTLQSLSGQIYATSAAMTLQSMNAAQHALSTHFDALLDGRAGDVAGMWSRRLDANGGMARSGYRGLSFQLDGALAGQDLVLGPHLMGGLLIDQADGLQRVDARLDHNRSHSNEALAYVGWSHGHWYALGSAGAGRYRQSVQRQLLLGSYTTGVATTYNGSFNSERVEGGYRLGASLLHLTPFADVHYQRIHRDGFAEQGGAGFGLMTGAQNLSRWRGGLGLRLSRTWRFAGHRSLSLDTRLAWQRTLAASGLVFDARFVGIDQWAPLGGVGLSRRDTVFALDLDGRLSDRTTLALGYRHDTGDRIHDSSLNARFVWRF